MAALLEGQVRALSNLHEALHHSHYDYVPLSADRFVPLKCLAPCAFVPPLLSLAARAVAHGLAAGEAPSFRSARHAAAAFDVRSGRAPLRVCCRVRESAGESEGELIFDFRPHARCIRFGFVSIEHCANQPLPVRVPAGWAPGPRTGPCRDDEKTNARNDTT